MTWRGETLSKTTVRSANTKASGASTGKREKSSDKDLVLLSQRKLLIFKYFISGQVYGWRENIDTFPLKNNRVAVIKRTFHNSGHL